MTNFSDILRNKGGKVRKTIKEIFSRIFSRIVHDKQVTHTKEM